MYIRNQKCERSKIRVTLVCTFKFSLLFHVFIKFISLFIDLNINESINFNSKSSY